MNEDQKCLYYITHTIILYYIVYYILYYKACLASIIDEGSLNIKNVLPNVLANGARETMTVAALNSKHKEKLKTKSAPYKKK